MQKFLRLGVIILLFILPVTGFINCASTQKEVMQSPKDYKQTAHEKYGERVDFHFNSSNSFILAISQQKATSQDPEPTLRFFIFDLNKSKIVFEDIVPKANASWKNDHQVEVIITPGIISADEPDRPMGYIYDIELQKKLDLQSR